MFSIEIIVLLLIGIVSGAYGMMVGAGGGFIFVPALLVILDMRPEFAAGTGLIIVVLNTLSGVLGFIKQNRVNYFFALFLTFGAVPGSLLGVWLARIASVDFFYIVFALLLISVGVFLMFQKRRSFHRNKAKQTHHITSWNLRLKLVWFGIFMGTVASFFGIGGGWLMVPILIYVFHLSPHQATATSVFSLCIYSIVGVGTHIANGHVIWDVALWGGIGAFIGAQIGVWISSKISGKKIVQLLSLLLIGVGITMIM